MIMLLLVVHFVADFLLQSREMGKKKSSELHWLLGHLAIQLLAFFIVLLPFTEWAFVFALLNATIHGVIDWNIWRLYKLSVVRRFPDVNPATYQYWEDHWFYATIGLDQLLHGLTLIGLAQLFL